jgi:hypothetical protein
MYAWDVWMDLSNGSLQVSDVVTVLATTEDEAEEKAIRRRQNWLGYGTRVEVTAIAANLEH